MLPELKSGDRAKIVVADNCSGCGRCVPVCPVRALSLESTAQNGFGVKKAVAVSSCNGCGHCLEHCPRGSLRLQQASLVVNRTAV